MHSYCRSDQSLNLQCSAFNLHRAKPCTRSLVALQLPLQDTSQEPLVQPIEAVPAYPVSHAAVHVLPLAVALQPPTGRLAVAGGAGSDVQ